MTIASPMAPDFSREQIIEAIRPCPFCGSDAEIDTQRAYRNLRTGSVETAVAVYCVSCAAEQAICHADVPGLTREMVIELWNARIGHTALTEATARVRVLEAAVVWQPIETAPHDGTEVDLWFGNAEFPERYLNCSWGLPDHTCGEAGQYCDSCPPPGELWRDWLHQAIENENAPTHWRLSDHGPAASPDTPTDRQEPADG